MENVEELQEMLTYKSKVTQAYWSNIADYIYVMCGGPEQHREHLCQTRAWTTRRSDQFDMMMAGALPSEL